VSFPGAVGPHDGFQLYAGGLLHLPGKSGMVLDLGIIHKKMEAGVVVIVRHRLSLSVID
jgi:hypothetical protein